MKKSIKKCKKNVKKKKKRLKKGVPAFPRSFARLSNPWFNLIIDLSLAFVVRSSFAVLSLALFGGLLGSDSPLLHVTRAFQLFGQGGMKSRMGESVDREWMGREMRVGMGKGEVDVCRGFTAISVFRR